MLKQIEEEEKAQIVRLGDASIASPFTSKLSTTQCGEYVFGHKNGVNVFVFGEFMLNLCELPEHLYRLQARG